MKKDADYWINRLNLTPHPEGGFFKETYRAPEIIEKESLSDRYSGQRKMSTAIYFLLKSDQVSKLHRLKSDEMWHFYTGSSLTVHVIDQNGHYNTVRLGPDPDTNDVFQAVVTAGGWFGATVNKKKSYSLVGCTVAPGFDFDDFELGDRETLLAQYPDHAAIIEKLTKKLF